MKAVLYTSGNTPACDAYQYLLAENGIELTVLHDVFEPDEILKYAKGADAIIDCGMVYFPREVIEKLDDTVKIIVRVAMGYEIIDVEAATERGIYVAPVPDYAMEEVAVMQAAHILATVRKVVLYDRALRAGKWTKVGYLEGYPSRRISTMTLGLLGFGRIAKNVAKYMKAFGMQVVAYDPFLPAEVFEQNGVIQAKTQEELYAVADIISPNIHLTEATRHTINAESIAKMKDGVIIINTGRGGLVCRDDLVAALESGKVRAAGLDVHEFEPFCDVDHPLMKMENVVLTPHIAYQTEESFQELQRKGIEFAIEGAKGGCPYSVVNKNARDAK